MSQLSQSDQPGTITRQEFGLLLAGLPLAALAFTDVPEELFPHCEANLTTAWKLTKGSDLPLAQSIVQAYLPALRPLAERPSRYQQEAAELVAKLLILNGLLEMHLIHLETRTQGCLQAVKYAEISENVELIVSARRWLSSTYYYLNNPTQALKEYQQTAKRKKRCCLRKDEVCLLVEQCEASRHTSLAISGKIKSHARIEQKASWPPAQIQND